MNYDESKILLSSRGWHWIAICSSFSSSSADSYHDTPASFISSA